MPRANSFDEMAQRQGTTTNAAFPILRTNSYGRMMISAQMNTHDRLIRNAACRTDCFLDKFAEEQMEYNRKMEKWRPGYNELQNKARDDEILAELIASATHRCDTELDHHILRFKKNRAKNPRYKPGWLESYVNGKNMAVHEELLRKAGPRIDNSPPKKAMQFRDFLRGCKYTRGGFLRPSKQRRPRTGDTTLPSIDGARSHSVPPDLGRPQYVVDACGREKRVNPGLVSKYSELVFQKHMDTASNDDVRSLYARANDSKMPLPNMNDFMKQQGVDIGEVETDMAGTYEHMNEMMLSQHRDTMSPFGLGTLREEDEEEGHQDFGREQENTHASEGPAEEAAQNEGAASVMSPMTEEQDGVAMMVSSDAAVTTVPMD